MQEFMTKIQSKVQITLIKIRLSKLELKTVHLKKRISKLVI